MWCQQQGGQAGPDNQRGTPRTVGRASQHRDWEWESQDASGSCQQLRGGAACRMGDLSSCLPPCLETACPSPEALLSKGVKLRKDWQSGQDERGCQASRVRYASIAIVDVVRPPWRAERNLAKAGKQLSPGCWASERGAIVTGADTRSGFRMLWNGTLGQDWQDLAVGGSGAVVSYQRRDRWVLVSLSIRSGHSRCLTLQRGRRAWGRDWLATRKLGHCPYSLHIQRAMASPHDLPGLCSSSGKERLEQGHASPCSHNTRLSCWEEQTDFIQFIS